MPKATQKATMTTPPPAHRKKKEVPEWRDSRAKELLVTGLEAGTIPWTRQEMPPRDVYNLHVEFQDYKYENFRTNLNNLRKAVRSRKKISLFEEDALLKDREKAQVGGQTMRGYPFWPTSDANQLLKQDIKEGRHLHMKPKILYIYRPEYQVFPLSVFRDHVHQELRSQRERPYWMHKKQQKKRQAQGLNIIEDKGQNEEAGGILNQDI